MVNEERGSNSVLRKTIHNYRSDAVLQVTLYKYSKDSNDNLREPNRKCNMTRTDAIAHTVYAHFKVEAVRNF